MMLLPKKQILFSLLLVAAAFALSVYLVVIQEKPASKPPQAQHPLVNVFQVQRQTVNLTVQGYGTVKPQVQIDIVPQVSGKVVRLASGFKTGGKFAANEILIAIDSQDYQLALERAKANIAQAQLQLDIELAEADVKRREREQWKRTNPAKKTPALALHQQQVNRAQAVLRAAEVELQKAELNLQRTKLAVPFAGRIVSESVDVGQYIVAGKPIASVYGVDVLEVQVPMDDSKLALFNLASDPSTPASTVEIIANFSGAERVLYGVVDRTAGVVDQKTRLLNVIIEVPLSDNNLHSQTLLPGMFVKVAINGKTLQDVIAVPRGAVRENQTVWVVEQGRLQIKPVRLIYRDHDSVYVSEGIDDGDMVVSSMLGVVTDNMLVRLHQAKRPLYGESASLQAGLEINDAVTREQSKLPEVNNPVSQPLRQTPNTDKPSVNTIP